MDSVEMDSSQITQQSISNGLHHTMSRKSSTNDELPSLTPMESRNWLMYLYYTRRQINKAIDVINYEIERSSGRNEYAHYLLGIIYMDESKLNEGLEEFQICNKLNPSNIDNIKQIAKCLFSQKRFKLALEAFMEAENISKKLDWEIHYWIAECLICLGGRDAALQWSKRSAKSGKQLAACKQLGKLLLRRGDLNGAIEAYTVALESAPDNQDLLTSLGLLHARMGQEQMAVERLGSALAVGTPQAAALLPLGAIIQSHGDYDVALSRYKIAAQQTPDCAALWNNVGMCFLGKQKLVAAISCLKRATALSPLSTRILHNLGLVHLISQQYASAFQYLCAALNLKPGSSTTLMLMGITLDHLKDYGNALRAYEKSVKISPDDLSTRLNYAIFLHSQRQLDLAKYHLKIVDDLSKRVSNLDREHIDAIVLLKNFLNYNVEDQRSAMSSEKDDPIYETIDDITSKAKNADAEKIELGPDEV